MDKKTALEIVAHAALQHVHHLRSRMAPSSGQKYSSAEIEEALKVLLPDRVGLIDRALYGARPVLFPAAQAA